MSPAQLAVTKPVFRSTQTILLAELLTKKADQFLRAECNLTYSQCKFLLFLKYRYGSTQRELAECLQLTQAAISRLAETLDQKGFISRQVNHHNRRENLLQLSTKGETQLTKAIELLHQMEKQLYDQVPAGQLKVFEAVVARLVDVLH